MPSDTTGERVTETTVQTRRGDWTVRVKGEWLHIVDEQGRERHRSRGHLLTGVFCAGLLSEQPYKSNELLDRVGRRRAESFLDEAEALADTPAAPPAPPAAEPRCPTCKGTGYVQDAHDISRCHDCSPAEPAVSVGELPSEPGVWQRGEWLRGGDQSMFLVFETTAGLAFAHISATGSWLQGGAVADCHPSLRGDWIRLRLTAPADPQHCPYVHTCCGACGEATNG